MYSAEQKNWNSTKLVATIGPATSSAERIEGILDAGVDVCRLNFSHGNHETHASSLKMIRTWAAKHDQPIVVLGDLCGPKIRLNGVTGGTLEIRKGDRVCFVRGNADCTAAALTTSFAPLIDEVDIGQRVFIDDGLVRLLVTERTADELVCACTTGGVVSSRKGINLPDTPLSTPALTEKDRRDLAWAIDNKLDYVALSFVRKPQDLHDLREIIDKVDNPPGVVAKIEKAEALEHLEELINLADGVMVARGDLGVEMDVWQVPLAQKRITERCRAAGKPVIIATQMLQSMIASPMPTRAEVSDVANAIVDRVDAVMLSAETAAGEYPVESVEMIARVARTTEAFLHRRCDRDFDHSIVARGRVTGAIAQAAVQAALSIGAKVVAVWSATGESVRVLARHRLPVPIIGLTYHERVYRRINLLHGVIPIRVEPIGDPAEMARTINARLLERALVEPGDLIVVVTSTRPKTPGATDTTLVHRVGEV